MFSCANKMSHESLNKQWQGIPGVREEKYFHTVFLMLKFLIPSWSGCSMSYFPSYS
jgi:hypothetical protein